MSRWPGWETSESGRQMCLMLTMMLILVANFYDSSAEPFQTHPWKNGYPNAVFHPSQRTNFPVEKRLSPGSTGKGCPGNSFTDIRQSMTSSLIFNETIPGTPPVLEHVWQSMHECYLLPGLTPSLLPHPAKACLESQNNSRSQKDEILLNIIPPFC